MEEYVTYTDPSVIKTWDSKQEAINFVEQHESGEVVRIRDNMPMYVKYPKVVWV